MLIHEADIHLAGYGNNFISFYFFWFWNFNPERHLGRLEPMINLFAPVNFLGMGIHAYNFAKALERSGTDICLIPPMGHLGFRNEIIDRWTSRRENFDVKNKGLMIFDMEWFAQFAGSERTGFAVFETDGFTPIQLSAMKSCDRILTPSTWGSRVLSNFGIRSEVIHEGYDPEEFRISEVSRTNQPFRFCHIGKAEERKGTMQLIRCFDRALDGEEAELMLHVENIFDPTAINQIVNMLSTMGYRQIPVQANGLASYKIKKADLSVVFTKSYASSVYPIYADSDCGIFPTKGEAWGLPIIECIASGVPTIVGNWSGQSEFLGDHYPQKLTLEDAGLEKAVDGRWYHGNRGHWRVPIDMEIIQKMKWAFGNARKFKESEEWKANVNRIRTEFTWDKAAEDFLKII